MLAGRAAQIQFFPVANPRHQLDPQQLCQTKDSGALTLGVGMDAIGPHLGLVLLNEIQDVMALPGAPCRELGVTRQTLYRHVSPAGNLREDGRKLLKTKRRELTPN